MLIVGTGTKDLVVITINRKTTTVTRCAASRPSIGLSGPRA